MRQWGTACLLAGAIALTGAARAADLPATPAAPPAPAQAASAGQNASPWRFEASLFGWAAIPSGPVDAYKHKFGQVKVGFGDLFPHRESVVMASLVARSDSFIVGGDFSHSLLSGSLSFNLFKSRFAPTISVTDARFENADFFAGYRLPIGPADFKIYGTVGLRYDDLFAHIVAADRAFDFRSAQSLNVNWLDPTVGLAASDRFAAQWFVEARGDVGGFGAGSKLTSQGLLAVGYEWTPSLSTSVGYRALYTDFNRSRANGDSLRYVTTIHGPFAGLTFSF